MQVETLKLPTEGLLSDFSNKKGTFYIILTLVKGKMKWSQLYLCCYTSL